MTVTIAKYLTPKGTDIHKNGIEPDIEATMSEKQMKTFTAQDLGTSKDSQYKAAEQRLIKLIDSTKRI